MPKCPKCGTHYDDLFDVSNCISSHHEERASAVLRPRVIEKPKPEPVVEARWINLPTGLFTGSTQDMAIIDKYFELFCEAFDSFVDFPTKPNGTELWSVNGAEPTMMRDAQLRKRLPIELMPNRRKKSTHGYFKYKLKRQHLHNIRPDHFATMSASDAVIIAEGGDIWRGYNCHITIAPNLPFQSVLCTLAHEMCHYAQYIECNRWITREGLGGGWGKSHGPTFVKQMKAFNNYARSVGSDLRVDKKCHSGRGHDKEVYDRIEWIRENLKKGDVFYWEWEGSDGTDHVGVYQCRGRYAHRVKGHYIHGTRVHDLCIPWSCIKYVWRPDFPEEHEPTSEEFQEVKTLVEAMPNKGRVV